MIHAGYIRIYIKIHKYLCIQLITHRIAVGVGVDRLRKQQRCWYWSASASFYVMCYVMQDSGSRVRLSTSWTSACACWVRSAGPPRHPRAPMAAVACGWPRDRDESVAIAALLHALCACVHRM